MKIIIKPNELKRRMGAEELESYMKSKRQGNGAHKSKKDYERKPKHKNS